MTVRSKDSAPRSSRPLVGSGLSPSTGGWMETARTAGAVGSLLGALARLAHRQGDPIACNRLPHQDDEHLFLIPLPKSHQVRIPPAPLAMAQWRLLPSGVAYAVKVTSRARSLLAGRRFTIWQD